MKKLFAYYRQMSLEERIVATTILTMTISGLMAVGKILVGLFNDYILAVIGIYNLLLLLAKLQCVLGIRKKGTFSSRNTAVAILLFLAGLLYLLYSIRMILFDVKSPEYSMFISIMIAFVSFVELGVAIFGLVQTKQKGHFYRDIKIINMVSALTAIMTTQIALLAASESTMGATYNGYTGMGIGIATVLLAIYIYFAPTISLVDREHNRFLLCRAEQNREIDMQEKTVKISLCKSRFYGGYYYEAEITENVVDGYIKKAPGFFGKLHLFWKILLLVLSEILIFVWLAGYFVFFCRSANMPRRLEAFMQQNGFEKDDSHPD